jgi:hypothetical protein
MIRGLAWSSAFTREGHGKADEGTYALLQITPARRRGRRARRRPRRAPKRLLGLPHELQDVGVQAVHMRVHQAVRRAFIDEEPAAGDEFG